jgi:LPXTG-motif cell wall-anchored protein
MSDDKPNHTKAVIAGAAIGSAAVAAALLFASKRKKKNQPTQLPPIPTGEAPETD